MNNWELSAWAFTIIVAFGLGWLVGYGHALFSERGGRDE